MSETLPGIPHKRTWATRLWPLEAIRRRVPYAYWLLYDAVILWALLTGNGTVRIICFVCLAIAVFFDVVEFIIKASESNLIARLFEGTGAPVK